MGYSFISKIFYSRKKNFIQIITIHYSHIDHLIIRQIYIDRLSYDIRKNSKYKECDKHTLRIVVRSIYNT